MKDLLIGSLACLVVGCGGAGAAPAAHPTEDRAEPSVALVVPPDLAEAAGALATERPHVVLHVVEPEPGTEEVARASEAVREAWRRYVAIELEEALLGIREAVVVLESHARSLEDFDLLAEALLVRGMAEMALGRDEPARESLLAAARLRPDRELDEGRYPPPVRERYETLRAELRAEPASSLTVTARPGGAHLILDGKPQGTAPDTLYATSGRHQLRVEAPGCAPRTLTVTFDPDGGQLEVELPRADATAAARQVLLGEDAALTGDESREALREALGALVAVRVRTDDGALLATRFDLRHGRVEGGRDADLAALLDAFAAPPPSEPAGAEDAEPSEARHNEGFYARAALGLALRTDELTAGENGSDGGSLAADLELAAGGSLAPGVVLGGAVIALLGGPELTLDDGRPRIGSVAGLALFLAWYPGAEGGWHLYGAVGASRAELREGGVFLPDQDLAGGLVALGGGYDWWIADDWALGGLLRLMGYTFRGEGVSWSAGGLSLVATLTYN